MLLGLTRRFLAAHSVRRPACELCGAARLSHHTSAAHQPRSDSQLTRLVSAEDARGDHVLSRRRARRYPSPPRPLLLPAPTEVGPPRRQMSRASAPSQDELWPPESTQLTPAQRLVAACPASVQPYLQLMRVDRPIGSWLLFWPCGWGLAQAAAPGCLPDPSLLAVYAAGAFIMRGAGCTINDLWDRDIDNKVERTRSRPLTSGRVSVLDALTFLSAQLSVGCLLLLQLNWSSVLLGVSSLSLVVLYPLMKRVTHWPQLVLGLTFNWGVLMAWASVQGQVAWLAALPLYLAGVCWTVVYDTIYAHQDKKDDLVLGMKSTALRFGDATPRWLAGFGAGMMTCLVAAGAAAHQTWPFYLGLTAVGVHIAQQIRTLNIYDAADCGDRFRSNRYVGLLLFLSIAAGRWWAAGEESSPLETEPPALAPAPATAARAKS